MAIINKKYDNLESRKIDFLQAPPFPHLVLDDFLDDEYFSKLKDSVESTNNAISGKSFDSAVEEKKWISLNSALPNLIRQIVDTLNTEEWVKKMRALTGVESLIATPNGNTMLANYHVMSPGGVLGSHVDHSSEPERGIPHILNIIIYLADDWNDKDGGATLLYDKKGKKVISRVPYKPNRAVIFLHTPYSFHGVERISSESKHQRKTIYVDYYSESLQPFKNMNLGFDSTWFRHGTTFKLDSLFDYFKPRNKNYTKTLLNYHFSRFRAKI